MILALFPLMALAVLVVMVWTIAEIGTRWKGDR